MSAWQGSGTWWWLALAAALGLACGDGTGPRDGDELDLESSSANYAYRFSGADPSPPDTVWQERWHAWVLDGLDLENPWPIEFLKYRDLAHLERMTGETTNGFAQPNQRRFHTMWSRDNHEAVHVLWVELVGRSPGFFNEGIAVAFHGDPIRNDFERSIWNGVEIHEVARTLLQEPGAPSADRLIVNDDFWDLPADTGYPLAGSFVRWLLDRRGIEAYKSFVRAVDRRDDAARIRSRFRTVYGEELDVYWSDWRAFLETV